MKQKVKYEWSNENEEKVLKRHLIRIFTKGWALRLSEKSEARQ